MDLNEKNNITAGTKSEPFRAVRDSVFRDLFSIPRYLLELYKVLHPEDMGATEADLGNVTIKNIIMGRLYNDLGFTARNRLLIMVEAQSTWSINILIRLLLYLADVWNAQILEEKFNIYGGRKLSFPKPEFYVVCTGELDNLPTEISLAEEFFGGDNTSIDLKARVICGSGSGDIIDQYITFTKIYEEQLKEKGIGHADKAIRETIRICMDRNILREYLESREKVVINIMTALFDQEYWTNIYGMEQRAEGLTEGMAAGRIEGLKESAFRMHSRGFTDNEISDCLGVDMDTVNRWFSDALTTA